MTLMWFLGLPHTHHSVVEDLQHSLPLSRLPGQQVEEAAAPGTGEALTQDQWPQGVHHGSD